MSVSAIAQLLLLAFGGFALVSASLASLAVRPVVRWTAAWSPETRHRALLLLAVAPMVVALFATVALFAPSLLAFGWPAHDHCLVHPGHDHFCFAHPPARLASAWGWLAIAAVAGFLAIRTAGGALEIWRASRWASSLLARASRDPLTGARVLPTPEPLCVMLGLFTPQTVLSRGLLRSVGPDELRAILEHERAHAERRDTLLRLVARICTSFMRPRRRKELLDVLDLAAEQSSDEVAAIAVGDRLIVADAILKAERLLRAAPVAMRPVAVSFGGVGVAARVTALLERPRPAHGTWPAFVLLVLVLVALLLGNGPFHHLIETLLGRVLS